MTAPNPPKLTSYLAFAGIGAVRVLSLSATVAASVAWRGGFDVRTLLLIIVAVISSFASARIADAQPMRRIVSCLTVVWFATPVVGLGVAVIACLSIAIADCITRSASFVEHRDGITVDSRIVGVAALIAATTYCLLGASPAAAVVCLAAGVVYVNAPRRFRESMLRASKSFGRLVAGVVSHATFGPLGIAALAFPWATGKLSASEALPLAGWAKIHKVGAEARRARGTSVRPFGTTAPSTGQAFRRRLSAAAIAVAVGACGVAGWRAVRPVSAPTPSAAFANEPWWFEMQSEADWALTNPGDALSDRRFPPQHDVTGKYLNIRNGYRVSWAPPECTCRRVRVWLYGGSVAFGLGQRDEFTIASMLSKLAYEDGYAVDVSNRGVLGDLAWEEAERFQWEVRTQDRPDVVLMYDGYNEVQAAVYRIKNGQLDSYPIDWGNDGLRPAAAQIRSAWLWMFGPRRPDAMSLTPPDAAPRPTAAEVSRHVLDHYEVARAIQRASVPAKTLIRWFWQPTAATSRPESVANAADRNVQPAAEIQQMIRRSLNPEVTDLHDVFDRVESPVFYDTVHTNELGAKIVAQRLYDEIKPELELRTNATASQ